ncbi:hypothetical protein [Hanstruepera neustonica]|uniref:hypothetical protein n=1 Tax=Hanstruepera neustonica TaxID=1445657 RepID=UPI000F4EA4FA|nr:hypothetical protein [Hanstruepera neustonica]
MSNFYEKPKKLVFLGLLFLVVGFLLVILFDYESTLFTGAMTFGIGLSHLMIGLNKLYVK